MELKEKNELLEKQRKEEMEKSRKKHSQPSIVDS